MFINGFIDSTTLDSINDGWDFNFFGELERYTVENGSTIYDVQYSYDDNGNVATKVETIGGITDSYVYAYDAQSRLSTVSKNNLVIASYTFDALSGCLKSCCRTGRRKRAGESFCIRNQKECAMITWSKAA